ncbi:hypothetical protein D9M71_536940 [compost metagenome]
MHLLDNVFDHFYPLSAGSAVQVKAVGAGVTGRKGKQTVDGRAAYIDSGITIDHHVLQLLGNFAHGVVASGRVQGLAFRLHCGHLTPAERETGIDDRDRGANIINQRGVSLGLAATVHADIDFAGVRNLLVEVDLLANWQRTAQAGQVVEHGQHIALDLDAFAVPLAPYVFRYGHGVAVEHAVRCHSLVGLVVGAALVKDQRFLFFRILKHQSAP